MRVLVLGLVAALGLSSPSTADAEPSEPAAEEPELPASAPDPARAKSETQVDMLDRVLPSGVRVMIARDDSLPVAAVVLSLESGSEDDPEALPGLNHALAYQLLMGNRGTAPGGIQALVQDAGGIAFLATGPAQTRFESLVPVTLLDEIIAAEAQRLRAPTVTESLWKETLISARRDMAIRRTTSWPAAAVAHGSAGLSHRPRVVSDALGELDVQTVRSELARRARYEFATIIVVAPLPLEDTFAKVEAATVDLPDRTRRVPSRTVAPSAGSSQEPMVVEQAKATGNTFVWAVAGDPASRLWADAWCETVSRQRRGKDEPKPNRVRCAFDDDPRRPTLTVHVRTPDDPRALLESRMQRLAGKGGRLLRGPRQRLEQQLAAETSTPLGLARRLAAAPQTPVQTPAQTSVKTATGMAALLGSPPDVTAVFPLKRAVRVVAPGATPPRTPAPDAAGVGEVAP